MEGLNIQPPQKRIEDLGEMGSRQEAISFVLELKGILSPYGLNVYSTKEGLSHLAEKEKNHLISSISDLIRGREINYVSEENKMVVSEIKKITGDALGTLIEKIALGDNPNRETMDEVIEQTANNLSVKIEDEVSFVFRKDNISLYDRTLKIEDFIKEELEKTTNDTRWNPRNIRRLLNRMMDSVKNVWNGFNIKSLIFKVGKNLVEKREKEFIEHGI